MRSSTRRALTLGAFAASALAWSGCEAKKQTEYVAGVSTQVQVPRDLRSIRIDVSVGGVVQFCRGYRVYDGRVQLPRSLGQFPAQGSPGPDPITVTVSGFTEEFSETTGNQVFDNCTSVAPKVGKEAGQGTRILRRSRQPYVLDEILFLPMPLKYSCFDHLGCDAEDKTCKGGRCVDAKIDESKLPKFTEDLVDGTGGACFPSSLCFAAGAPAVVVDAETCTYALPNSPPSSPELVAGAPPNPFPKSGEGLNVEVTYDGGLNREILDKEEGLGEEGFIIPDRAKPQQFRLAPGLCDLAKGFGPPTPAMPEGVPTEHRITAIRVSGTCKPKGPFQPLCAGDQLAAMGVDESGIAPESNPPPKCQPIELKPPKSVLMVVADNTTKSELFYQQAPGQTVAVPLSDPAFQTAQIGLQFYPGDGVCATPGSFKPFVDPELARLARGKIRDAFEVTAKALKPDPANLDGALRDAYTTLSDAKFAEHFRRAVLVLGNHDFEPPLPMTCGQTPAQRATVAKTVNKIETYVLMLARDQTQADPNAVVASAQSLAVAGGTERVYDARASKIVAQDAFQAIVNDIATCVYDVADVTTRPTAADTLTYTDPIDPSAPTVSLPFNAACSTEQASGAGFGLDASNQRRVYLCKASCDAYRAVLRNASLYAAQYLMPSPAVPVFSHRTGCTPKAGGKGAGSTPQP